MQHVNDQRLYRSHNRLLGGVCAGLAEAFGINPLWVRVAFLVLVFVQGVGLFLYVVLWVVMPERLEEGGERSGFDAMTADLRRIWAELQPGRASQATASSPPGSPPGSNQTSVPPPPSPAVSGSRTYGAWQNQPVLLGVILVAIGLALLGGNIGIINWSLVWPAALITVGIVILVRNLERRP